MYQHWEQWLMPPPPKGKKWEKNEIIVTGAWESKQLLCYKEVMHSRKSLATNCTSGCRALI